MMKIFDSFDTIYSPSNTCAVTIGSFDGVHLGHKALIDHIRKKIGANGTLCVVTFSNHPSQVLPNREPVPQILSKNLKLKELEKLGVNVVFCIEFTPSIAQLSYEEFLQKLQRVCPFSLLVLGEGASLGRKREGTPEKVQALGEKMGFVAEYIDKEKVGSGQISSNRIRQCIHDGNLEEARELLGHPLSFEAIATPSGIKRAPDLCLPKQGTYPILIVQNSAEIKSTIYFEGIICKIADSTLSGPIQIGFL